MKKQINIFSFIILNLIISSNLFVCPIYGFIFWLGFTKAKTSLGQALGFCFVSFLWVLTTFVVFLIKISIFPLIYKNSEEQNSVHLFFQKIMENNKFAMIVLLVSLITDKLVLFVINPLPYSSFVSFFSFFAFGGVFICYLSLIVWFKVKKQNREIDERNDRQICD